MKGYEAMSDAELAREIERLETLIAQGDQRPGLSTAYNVALAVRRERQEGTAPPYDSGPGNRFLS